MFEEKTVKKTLKLGLLVMVIEKCRNMKKI